MAIRGLLRTSDTPRHPPRMAPRRIPGRIQRPTNRNRRTPAREGPEMNEAIGKYIADSRRRNFYSQRHLADRMNEQFGHNWHQTVISKIENDERQLKADELFH